MGVTPWPTHTTSGDQGHNKERHQHALQIIIEPAGQQGHDVGAYLTYLALLSQSSPLARTGSLWAVSSGHPLEAIQGLEGGPRPMSG